MNKNVFLSTMLCLFLLFTTSNVLALDDATVEQIKTDATEAKNKADQNKVDIFSLKNGLPAEIDARRAGDAFLQNQISNLQQGTQGLPGLSCWDLSGEDVCDPGEDINNDGYCDALDCQGVTSATIAGSTYRWNMFSTYDISTSSYPADGNQALFGGFHVFNWRDGATAEMISSEKDVQRSFFTKKGYGGKNAVVVADQWYGDDNLQSKHAVALFRVKNTTAEPIDWHVEYYCSATISFPRNELASVALNGTSVWVSDVNYDIDSSVHLSLAIPAAQTSTVIFVSSSSRPNSSKYRGLVLAFGNDSLELPAGLEYVDDLDSATGGWEQ